MKNKDFAGLAQTIVGGLAGIFRERANGGKSASEARIAVGSYFEGSSFDAKSFYVWTFFLPLFVPAKHVSFNFGKRTWLAKWRRPLEC